jgi:hypothetical protein
MLTALLLAASLQYQSPPPWQASEKNLPTFSSWKAGEKLFIAVDDANVRAGPAMDAAASAKLPIGTAVEILEAGAAPVKVDDRYNRWYRVRSTSPAAEGFVFGSVLTPFALTDGATVTAMFTTGPFVRVRLHDPKSKKTTAVDLAPLPFNGTTGGTLEAFEALAPNLWFARLCDGTRCDTSFLEQRAKKLQLIRRVSGAADVSLERDKVNIAATPVLARVKDRWLPYVDDGPGGGASPKAKAVLSLKLGLADEPRGPNDDVTCYALQGAKIEAYPRSQLVDCAIQQGGKGGPDEIIDHYFAVEGNEWTALGKDRTYASELRQRLKSKGKKLDVSPLATLPYMEGFEGFELLLHVQKVDDGVGLEPAVVTEAMGVLRGSAEQVRQLRNGQGNDRLLAGNALVWKHPVGGALLFVFSEAFASKDLKLEGDHRWSSALQSDCGPAFYEDLASETVHSDDLELVGVAKTTPVYALKSGAHPLLAQLLRELPEATKGLSADTIAAARPLLFTKDPLGRWLEHTRDDMQVPQLCEPMIYLYAETAQPVHVALGDSVRVQASEPRIHANGWDSTATPHGTRLFWEGRSVEFPRPAQGFSVPGERSREFLREVLPRLGLQGREVNEFMAAWAPRLERSSNNVISFHVAEEIDRIAPLFVSPLPDTVIRVLMDFRPGDGPVEAPRLPPTPERHGLTLVEWGGVLR